MKVARHYSPLAFHVWYTIPLHLQAFVLLIRRSASSQLAAAAHRGAIATSRGSHAGFEADSGCLLDSVGLFWDTVESCLGHRPGLQMRAWCLACKRKTASLSLQIRTGGQLAQEFFLKFAPRSAWVAGRSTPAWAGWRSGPIMKACNA